MSVLWLRRVGDTLVPDSTEAAADFSRLPPGRPLKTVVTCPRNGKHHRLYWLICKRIANAVGTESDVISDMLKIATGHCRIVKSKTMGVLKLPKSIAWSAMDQQDFNGFFDRVMLAIKENWGGEALEAIADLVEELKL